LALWNRETIACPARENDALAGNPLALELEG
jgi:hypothetical protein